jgi:DNA-binding response OmpR family regulator
LENADFTVRTASNGQDALKMIARERPDLVVLDIIMPGLDGLEVCRRIRADPYIAKLPILFLTAKGRPNDVAQGLDAGGDDFLTKPFEVVELPARVRALLRRAPGGALDTEAEYLTVGDIKLHATRAEVHVGERAIELTSIEHQLLHYLMLHAGQPIPALQLLRDVWQYPVGTGDPILVRVHIGNLRAKIEPQPDTPRYILNVRGRGYVLNG